MRVLFICKKHLGYNGYGFSHRSSGLFNSTEMIAKSLRRRKIKAKVVVVQDNNCIDREVSRFKPDVVIIEALWVVPEKFKVLKKLHKKVKWFIHLHSNVPFLASEGIAIEWLFEYKKLGVEIIVNSKEAFENLRIIIPELKFLPNIYAGEYFPPRDKVPENCIRVGCFGAIRPMKNQLIQALAAIEFCHRQGMELVFHINDSRVESAGGPVLKNIENLFKSTRHTTLIKHPWHSHDSFIHYLRHHIDIGMQVSLTETFNIVTADYVAAGIPTVTSEEITWVSGFNTCKANSVDEIVDRMDFVFDKHLLIRWNQHLLKVHSEGALYQWMNFLEDL